MTADSEYADLNAARSHLADVVRFLHSRSDDNETASIPASDKTYTSLFDYVDDMLASIEDTTERQELASYLRPIIHHYYQRHPELYTLMSASKAAVSSESPTKPAGSKRASSRRPAAQTVTADSGDGTTPSDAVNDGKLPAPIALVRKGNDGAAVFSSIRSSADHGPLKLAGDVTEMMVVPLSVERTLETPATSTLATVCAPVHTPSHRSRVLPPCIYPSCVVKDESVLGLDWGVMNSFAPRYDSADAVYSSEESAWLYAWLEDRKRQRLESAVVAHESTSTDADPTMEHRVAADAMDEDAQPADGKLDASPPGDDAESTMGPAELQQFFKENNFDLDSESEAVRLQPSSVDLLLASVTSLLMRLADMQLDRVVNSRVPETAFRLTQSLTGLKKNDTAPDALRKLTAPTDKERRTYHQLEGFLCLLIKDLPPSFWTDRGAVQGWMSNPVLVGSREPNYRGTLPATSRSYHETTNQVHKRTSTQPSATVPQPPQRQQQSAYSMRQMSTPRHAMPPQMANGGVGQHQLTPQMRQMMMNDPRTMQAYHQWQAYQSASAAATATRQHQQPQ